MLEFEHPLSSVHRQGRAITGHCMDPRYGVGKRRPFTRDIYPWAGGSQMVTFAAASEPVCGEPLILCVIQDCRSDAQQQTRPDWWRNQ